MYFQLYKKEWHLNFLWHFSSELGGNLDHDHPAWLEHCVEVSTKRNGEVVTMSSSQPSTPVRSHPTLEQLESLPVIICSNGMGSSGEGENNWFLMDINWSLITLIFIAFTSEKQTLVMKFILVPKV